eukprot:187051-Prymnesium_polylepis.1
MLPAPCRCAPRAERPKIFAARRTACVPLGSCCEWFGHSVYKSDILRCSLAGSAALLERY